LPGGEWAHRTRTTKPRRGAGVRLSLGVDAISQKPANLAAGSWMDDAAYFVRRQAGAGRELERTMKEGAQA